MDYRTIKAGRELDALVAEKVMGWKWFQVPKWDYYGPLPEQGKVLVPPGFDWENHNWPPKGIVRFDAMLNCHRFHPSTDIKEAWKVVERLRHLNDDKGFRTEISIGTDTGMWECNIGMEGWAASLTDEFAETAPVAICRAALIAVTEETDGTLQDTLD